jgi:Ca2+-binding RTX toxin-like protein
VRFAAGLVCLALTVPAATAGAATVAIDPHGDSYTETDIVRIRDALVFTAAAGEINQVRIAYEDGYRGVTVTDATARLAASEPCEAVDEHTVRCPSSELYRARLDLGDGDDTFVASEPGEGIANVEVTAGAGSDSVRGPSGDDRIDGGPGEDELMGGAGDDSLQGGGGGTDHISGMSGDDAIQDGDGAAPDVDFLNGNDGDDLVSYEDRVAGVTIDLARTTDQGAGDFLTTMEDAVGGPAGDVLTGSSASNDLRGGGGDDVIAGADGDDVLDGGEGRDGYACGGGSDRVVTPEAAELLPADCETQGSVGFHGEGLVFPVHPYKVTRRWLAFMLDCPTTYTYLDYRGGVVLQLPCRTSLQVHSVAAPRTLLGKGTSKRDHNGPHRLRVDLTRAGRRQLARKRGVRVVVSLGGSGWQIRIAR